MPSEKSFIG
jgi:hypothetical protein